MGRLTPTRDIKDNLLIEILMFDSDEAMVECYVFDSPVTVEEVGRLRDEMTNVACDCNPEAEMRDFGDDVVFTAAKVVHPVDCTVAKTMFKSATDRAAAPPN